MRRPSVVRWNDSLLIAFERDIDDDDDEGQEIVVATQTEIGTFVLEVVAQTSSEQPLDIADPCRAGRAVDRLEGRSGRDRLQPVRDDDLDRADDLPPRRYVDR